MTLPLLGPTLRVSVFLSMIGALQLFDMVWVMTGGGPLNASNTMAIDMFKAGFKQHQMGYGSALAVILFLCGLVVALAYQRFVLRRDIDGADHGVRRLTRWRRGVDRRSTRRRPTVGRDPRAASSDGLGLVALRRSCVAVAAVDPRPDRLRGPRRLQDERPARWRTRSRSCPTRGSSRTTPTCCRRERRRVLAASCCNSLVIAAVAVVVTVGVRVAGGVRRSPGSRFRGREAMYTLFVFGLLFPSAVAILPLYILVRELGLSATRSAWRCRRRRSRCR